MATQERAFALLGEKDIIIDDLNQLITAQKTAISAMQTQASKFVEEIDALKLQLDPTEQLTNGEDLDPIPNPVPTRVEPDPASGGEAGSGPPSSDG